MTGRVNHRGWIVANSVASADGAYCIDFFEHPDGGFGFEHFRSDPEDMGQWTALGGSGPTRYSNMDDAVRGAAGEVAWFTPGGPAV